MLRTQAVVVRGVLPIPRVAAKVKYLLSLALAILIASSSTHKVTGCA